MNKLKKLRKFFEIYKLDGYLVPKNDEFFGEYVEQRDDRLNYISSFSGSAGYAIILKKNSYLFVDGRYTVQAKKESFISFVMNRMYRGDWVESIASRFIDELPAKNIKKEEIKEQNNEDFFFNQDIDYNEGVRSPGWARLQKKKLKRIK